MRNSIEIFNKKKKRYIMCCETIKDGSFYNPLNQGYLLNDEMEK